MDLIFYDYQVNAAWGRVLLSGILLFSASMLKRSVSDDIRKRNSEFLQGLALFLAIKDIVFMFSGSLWLLAVSDVLTVSAYYFITASSTSERGIDPYYYRGVLLFHIFIMFYFRGPAQVTSGTLYGQFALLNSLVLGLRLFIFRDRKNSITSRLSIAAPVVLILYSASVFIAGYSSPLVTVLIMPLFYLLHLYFLYLNLASEYRFRARTIKFMNEEQTSTYEFFENIGRVMLEKKNIDEVNEYIISTIIEKSGAESGAVLFYDDNSGQLYISASSGNFIFPCDADERIKTDINYFREFFGREKFIPDGTLFDEVFKKGQPVFINDFFRMRHDPLCKENTGNNLIFISSLILVPLVINGGLAGMVCLEHNTPGRFFTGDIFDVVSSLSVYAEIMISNISVHREILEKRELDRDISITSGIQKSLLPLRIPFSDKFNFAVYSEPARYVSGDYYDFIKLKSGRIAFLICDVAGKGVAAGLVMTVIRTIVHLIANQGWRTASIMKMINRGIFDIGGDHFATALFFVYDPETGTLEYSNAAHLPALLYRKSSSEITYLDTEGLPLGIDRKSDYESSLIRLESGDLLFLYTDGINETMNSGREQFGRERINSIIKDNSTLRADSLSEILAGSLKTFRGDAPQHDDQTFLILKIPEERIFPNQAQAEAVC